MKLDDKRISQAHRIALSGRGHGRIQLLVNTDFLCDLISDYRTLQQSLFLVAGEQAEDYIQRVEKAREATLTRKDTVGGVAE